MAMVHIHDDNFEQFIDHTGDDGQKRMKGLVPRNYGTHPVGCYKSIPEFAGIPLMTDAEINAAIVQKNADKSWLSDLREVGMYGQRIPALDQDGFGYCWAHSGVSANLLVRARDNQPFADLSAFSVACIIKNYRNEGGWGAEGVEWQMANGCATSKTWPQQSTNRSNDNPAMRAEAALYKPTGTWMDMQPRDVRAMATCLCKNFPVVVDFNWWSHSVCACKLISWNPLSILIMNSWGNAWSENGMGILSGNKAVPDGQVALVTVRVSA